MATLLWVVFTGLVVLAGMPFLIIFLEVVGAWYDNLFDRLEAAADRFCIKHGWF